MKIILAGITLIFILILLFKVFKFSVTDDISKMVERLFDNWNLK